MKRTIIVTIVTVLLLTMFPVGLALAVVGGLPVVGWGWVCGGLGVGVSVALVAGTEAADVVAAGVVSAAAALVAAVAGVAVGG